MSTLSASLLSTALGLATTPFARGAVGAVLDAHSQLRARRPALERALSALAQQHQQQNSATTGHSNNSSSNSNSSSASTSSSVDDWRARLLAAYATAHYLSSTAPQAATPATAPATAADTAATTATLTATAADNADTAGAETDAGAVVKSPGQFPALFARLHCAGVGHIATAASAQGQLALFLLLAALSAAPAATATAAANAEAGTTATAAATATENASADAGTVTGPVEVFDPVLTSLERAALQRGFGITVPASNDEARIQAPATAAGAAAAAAAAAVTAKMTDLDGSDSSNRTVVVHATASASASVAEAAAGDMAKSDLLLVYLPHCGIGLSSNAIHANCRATQSPESQSHSRVLAQAQSDAQAQCVDVPLHRLVLVCNALSSSLDALRFPFIAPSATAAQGWDNSKNSNTSASNSCAGGGSGNSKNARKRRNKGGAGAPVAPACNDSTDVVSSANAANATADDAESEQVITTTNTEAVNEEAEVDLSRFTFVPAPVRHLAPLAASLLTDNNNSSKSGNGARSDSATTAATPPSTTVELASAFRASLSHPHAGLVSAVTEATDSASATATSSGASSATTTLPWLAAARVAAFATVRALPHGTSTEALNAFGNTAAHGFEAVPVAVARAPMPEYRVGAAEGGRLQDPEIIPASVFP